MKTEKKLNMFKIAFIYIGTMVGAGFASGREVWQFFGVFGKKGLFGLVFVGLLFMAAGVMTAIIARIKRTDDIGRIICPWESEKLTNFIGYLVAVTLFVIMMTMCAAMGSLFSQQFSGSKILGGLLLVLLVSITLTGGFERMEKIFHGLVPVLMMVIIIVCVFVITKELPLGKEQMKAIPSPLAPNWMLAPILYISFNILAIVPIISAASVKAANFKHAVAGPAIGGAGLFVLAFIIYKALATDGGYAQAMDMPMLAFASKLGPVFSIVYTVIMFFAIYASASGNFYGFTTKLKNDGYKNIKITVFGLIAFVFGLMGFKNIVAYVFPVMGILGLAIFAMIVINFIKVFAVNFITTQEKHKYDLPKGAINVTTGHGGACILFIGDEKTALADCGNAYCGEHLVEKLKKELGERPLDYLILSHTHYDHIGALPSIRKEWPDLTVFGAAHGKQVLEREGALRTIKKLGDEAAALYGDENSTKVTTEGMWIDKVIGEGDIIDLGGKEIHVMETPGHTRCSLTFVIEPMGLMLACESVGVLERKGVCHPAILHDYDGAIASIEKCRAYDPKRIIISHYGIVPAKYNKKLWALLENEARIEKEIIEKAWKEEKSEDEILSMMQDRYLYEGRVVEQPLDAFNINMLCTIRLYKPKGLEQI